MRSRQPTRDWALTGTLCVLCGLACLSCSDEDTATGPDPIPRAACCLPDGTCEVLSEPECAEREGDWLETETLCNPNPCPPDGACCFPDGVCELLTETACEDRGGEWQGEGTVCRPNPCPQTPYEPRYPVGDMLWIPEGFVRLGQSYVSEPVHDLWIDGFWIGRYPVTNGEYKQFIDAGGYHNPTWWNPTGWDWRSTHGITLPAGWNDERYHGGGVSGYEYFPVIGVSWWEADAYCRWGGGRLPDEVEWEKAAKGGCETRGSPHDCGEVNTPSFPWGEGISGQRANYWCSDDPYDNSTTPVGYYDGSNHGGFQTVNSPSPYGLYDVAGNAWELTSTRWAAYPYNPKEDREDPPGHWSECCRVARGGSWNHAAGMLRCAYRFRVDPSQRYYHGGFRLAKD